MAENGNGSGTPQERFEQYNPYAARAVENMDEQSESERIWTDAQLAVAYALDRLRTEIHFAGKADRRGSQ